jgi:predicted ATPase/class 3 adenylate cyclase
MNARGGRTFPGDVISLLFTDIEGSTKLWETQPAAMSDALSRHDIVLRQTIESCGGQVFKTVGDAFCAVFASTHDAVAAAVKAQQALADEPWPPEAHLRVRMAVHAGECEQRDDDFFGPTVNRIARLLSIGHGGQVLLSGVAGELVAGRVPPDVTVVDMGEHRLKDLGRREHVFEVRFSGQPTEFPPLHSLDNPQWKHNLPEQWSSFVGRDAELGQLSELLSSRRLITLVGPGGTGKTRLALQAVAELVDSTPGGVWLVELAPVSEPSNVDSAVADTLGVRERPGCPRVVSIVETLQNRRLVVLLDNCEHVIEAAAEIVDAVLRHCAGVTLLATSREPLQIDGEQLFHVAALSTPSSTTTIEQSDAVRLLVDRAQHHNQDFTLGNEDPTIVASLVRHLDGIPLAIELAAARLGSMSLSDIHQRLDQRFRLLDGGSRAAQPRQRTLRALIDWSYELLTTDDQLVLQRLSVFPSTWTLAAAEAIVSDETVTRSDVASVHDSLVAKNLVQRVDTESGTRYRLLDTVHAYAAEKLAAVSPDAEARLRQRHLDAYIDAYAGDSWTVETDSVPARIEIDNLWAAIETALQHPHDNRHLRLAVVLDRCVLGFSTRLGSVLRTLLERAGDAATSDTIGAWLALGTQSSCTDPDLSRHAHEEAVRVATVTGDDDALAHSLTRLCGFEELFGDGPSVALAVAETALRYAEKAGKQSAIWEATLARGFVLQNLGDLGGAQTDFRSALSVAESRNDPYTVGETLCALADNAILLEDWPLATDWMARVRDIPQLSDLPWFSCVIDVNLATIAQNDQRPEEAFAFLHRASSNLMLRDERDLMLASYVLFCLASVTATVSDSEGAAVVVGAGDATAGRIGLNVDGVSLVQRDRACALAANALGDERFAAAYERGCQLSTDEALAIALADRPLTGTQVRP